MTAARVFALWAALAMATPSLAEAGADSVLWVELCGATHPGLRIPIPLRPGEGDSPGKACHAAVNAPADRRVRASLPQREGDPWPEE